MTLSGRRSIEQDQDLITTKKEVRDA